MENKDVYFNFLEDLRKSGVTNMFGATPYLEANFEELSHAEAVAILKEWMQDYNALSVRLGWDKSDDVVIDDETGEPELPESEYSKLFDEDIDKDVIDNFLKLMADKELMSELDKAKHIFLIDDLPFIVSYEDGSGKLFSVVGDELRDYGDKLSEYCSDFNVDFDKAKEDILSKTGLDFSVKEEPFEDDSEEVYDYGTEAVIEDDVSEEE